MRQLIRGAGVSRLHSITLLGRSLRAPQNQNPPATPPQTKFVTRELSGGQVFVSPSRVTNAFKNRKNLSLSTVIRLDPSQQGVIIEGGGTGNGFLLYQLDGSLYFQAGRGNASGPGIDRAEASYIIPRIETVVLEATASLTGVALFINGALVSFGGAAMSLLSGGNEGGVGFGRSSVAVNRGGFNSATPPHPALIELVAHPGKRVADEKLFEFTDLSISGPTAPAEGDMLSGIDIPGVAYQWRRNGDDIPNATGAGYVLTAADVGADITRAATAFGRTEISNAL